MKILITFLLISNIAFSQSEVLIQFQKNTSNKQIDAFLNRNHLAVLHEIPLSNGKCYLVKTEKNVTELRSNIVKYAEPNRVVNNVLAYVPNDPYFELQWAAINLGYNVPPHDPYHTIYGVPGIDMGTDSAWNYTRGSNKVIVALVDTGVDTTHEDLRMNIIPGSGYDFINNQPGAFDDHYHGTSCCGVLGAIGNNLLGGSGVCPVTKIFPVKVVGALPIPWATEYSFVMGVIYAYQQGAWVSSNSWAWWDSIPPSPLIQQAIADGVRLGRHGKGTVYVFPANNHNIPYTSYPARDSNVIGVGAINPCGKRQSNNNGCSWEGWGSNYDEQLDIMAPGIKNVTTGIMNHPMNNYGNYRKQSGTSSSTPMVAGVCALILSIDSSLTYREVREIIISTATKLPDYTYDATGFNIETGYGLVSANRAVQEVFYNGNINQDNVIDLTDVLAVNSDANNFVTGTVRTDVNRDSFVDLKDLLKIQEMAN